MSIQVVFFGPLERWAGKKEFFTSGSSIKEVFDSLEGQIGKSLIEHLPNPENDSLKSHFHVLINGIDTDSESCLETSVKEGDIITIVPPVGGG
ncbi:MAG: MoaD/ThiS family protein [Candidatus Hodarchaeales archaeon]